MDFKYFCGAFLTSIALLWCISARASHHQNDASPEERYDLRRLMQPSPAERAAEQRGHVHIYDALEINEVNTALDANFERIQNMMFTRIHHLPPTGAGSVEVEDDGCD